MFPKNSGTPKSSTLIGFSIKPSILGYPYFWKHPVVTNTSFSGCFFTTSPGALERLAQLQKWKTEVRFGTKNMAPVVNRNQNPAGEWRETLVAVCETKKRAGLFQRKTRVFFFCRKNGGMFRNMELIEGGRESGLIGDLWKGFFEQRWLNTRWFQQDYTTWKGPCSKKRVPGR